MVKHLPFTKYEAAVLLDAYLTVLSGKLSKPVVVAVCSQMLRAMAINSHLDIDSSYRSPVGISGRMSAIESAYKGKNLHNPATRQFTDIVQLYLHDNQAYQELLDYAKRLALAPINNEADTTMNNSETTKTPISLSKKTFEEPLNPHTSTGDELHSEASLSVKTFEEPVNQPTNTGDELTTTISLSKKTFEEPFNPPTSTGDESDTEASLSTKAVEEPMESPTNNGDKSNTEVSLSTSTSNEPTSNDEPITESDSDNMTANDTNDLMSINTPPEILSVDFNNFNYLNFSYTKPLYLSYKDNIFDTKSWRHLFSTFCSNLIIEYRDDAVKHINTNMHGNFVLYCADYSQKKQLRSPQHLIFDYYLEANLDAKFILRKIHQLWQIYNLQNKILITYVRTAIKNTTLNPNTPQTTGTNNNAVLPQDSLLAKLIKEQWVDFKNINAIDLIYTTPTYFSYQNSKCIVQTW